MLHGAVLADPATGRAAVFVGPSGVGKTTLAHALGHVLGYVTDETAAIEPDGSVRPYPKPLSVRSTSDGTRVKAQLSPAELGLVPPPDHPVAVRVILLARRTDAGPPRLEPVDLLPALAATAEQCSHLQLLDRPLHRLAAVLEPAGGLRRLVYRDAADVVPLAAGLLEAG
jgi:hypothetical protein